MAVHIRQEGGALRLTLCRPEAIHALTTGMCADLSQALLEWRDEAGGGAVMIDHAGGRGFCAGGDVAQVRRLVQAGDAASARAFFCAEYRLDHLLFSSAAPVITFMDGVTMGGGMGLALPARYRIATQNSLLAMPEGAIGLFPDVGACWHLARLPGHLGRFLVLTGARLDGAEALWAGLATHYLPSESLPEAKARIAADPAPAAIEQVLGELSVIPPPARLAGNAARIAALFADRTLEGILAALATDGSRWAEKERQAIGRSCPTSAKVALRLLEEARAQTDFAAQMAREYALAARMIARPDFAEGVRAVLVDKDLAPRWQPADPAAVSPGMIAALFAPPGPAEGWSPLI